MCVYGYPSVYSGLQVHFRYLRHTREGTDVSGIRGTGMNMAQVCARLQVLTPRCS